MTANELALQMHKKWNGKIETTAKSHVRTREDLAIAYTPGVAEPCNGSLHLYNESKYNCRCL